MPKTTKAKKYFKTRGIIAVGSCSHKFKTRISLGVYAGADVTAKNDRIVNTLIREAKKHSKLSECPTCVSEEILQGVEKSNKEILESLSLPLFPKISGGIGQRAWAERARNEHLRYLLFGGMSPHLSLSVLEFILSTQSSDKVKSESLRKEIQTLKLLKTHFEEAGYLGKLYRQELESASERVLLRRLLISRALVKNNRRLFEELRHTFWIMYEKRGNSAYNTRFVNLSQSDFLAITYIVNQDLESIEEYEKSIEVLSKKAYASDREILKSLSPECSVLEKAELMQVYNSLSDKEQDLPF